MSKVFGVLIIVSFLSSLLFANSTGEWYTFSSPYGKVGPITYILDYHGDKLNVYFGYTGAEKFTLDKANFTDIEEYNRLRALLYFIKKNNLVVRQIHCHNVSAKTIDGIQLYREQ